MQPTIWQGRNGKYFWSTLEPHEDDVDPTVPAGPFDSYGEAQDDCRDFVNDSSVQILASCPDRFLDTEDAPWPCFTQEQAETHGDNRS